MLSGEPRNLLEIELNYYYYSNVLLYLSRERHWDARREPVLGERSQIDDGPSEGVDICAPCMRDGSGCCEGHLPTSAFSQPQAGQCNPPFLHLHTCTVCTLHPSFFLTCSLAVSWFSTTTSTMPL